MMKTTIAFTKGLLLACLIASPALPATKPSADTLTGLGLSSGAKPVFTRLYANDSASASGKALRSLEVANLEGITVFRLHFEAPYNAENTLTQLYLDLDNDAKTGRTGNPTYNGVDVQLACDRGKPFVNYHPGGQEKVHGNLKIAIEDGDLYFAAMLRLAGDEKQACVRLAYLSEQFEPRKAWGSVAPMLVRFPYAPKDFPAAPTGAEAKGAAPATQPVNAGFEEGDDAQKCGWSLWSRDSKVKAEFTRDAKAGKRALDISHDGSRDFNIENAPIPVKAGEAWLFKIWARMEEGSLSFNAYTLSKGKVIRWNSAMPYPENHASATENEWKELTILVMVPEGVDQVCPRVLGDGKARGRIDELRMEPAPRELANGPVRPKVEGFAQSRLEEKWDRGLVALREPDGVYLGWRLLRTDAPETVFHVWRAAGNAAPVRLTSAAQAKTTDFLDRNPPATECFYWVVPSLQGKDGAPSEKVAAGERQGGSNYLSVAMPGPVQKVGLIDLDGDGRLDFVVKHPGANFVDPCVACNYWRKSADTYKIEARRSDGRQLWVHDMGWSIEQGIWYSPYVVWDFNGDGVPEVACKGADGDHRDATGLVGAGDEWVFILDGRTGKEITRAPWPSRQGMGDYNLFSRNQCGIAYLDGKTPALILARGTYSMMKCEAWQLRGKALEKLWAWTSLDEGSNAAAYIGQGAHSMHCADLDGDGRDEVMLGACVLDDNGRGLWSTGRGHPDHAYLGDIDPQRPGLEVYYGHEFKQQSNGMCLVDARTGALLWGLAEPSTHIHSTGFCGDIDPTHPGMECWGGESPASHTPGAPNPFNRFLFAASGELIAKHLYGDALQFFGAYWDADLQREIVTGGKLVKYPNTAALGRIEGSVILVADLLGDWREEIVTSISNELRLYTTTIPARDRRTTLLHDRIYRNDVAHTTMGYIQGPTTSYCLDQSVPAPVRLSISLNSNALEPGKSMGGMVRLESREKGVETEVELAGPAGVRLEPAKMKLSAAKGKPGTASFTVQYTPPPSARLDQRAEELTLTAKAKTLDLSGTAGVRIPDVPPSGGLALEAEAFAAQGGGEVKIRTDKVGARGECFSHWDKAGHWLSLMFTVAEEGEYALEIRYCNESPAARKITLDRGEEMAMAFPSSGGMSSVVNEWRHAYLMEGNAPRRIRLAKGEHELRLENTDGLSLNLDYLVWMK